jgi:hypothetical protein
LTGGECGAHGLNPMALADGNQPHRVLRPARGTRGSANAHPDLLQQIGN